MMSWVIDHDTTHEAGQVNDVNGRHEILTVSNVRQASWALNPCPLEMVIKDALSVSVPDSRAKYMDTKLRLGVN